MNIKRGLWFLFVILVFPVVSADTSLFSGTVESGKETLINDQPYTFTYIESMNRTFANIPTGSNLIIDEEGCESNNVMEVCIEDIAYSHRNYEKHEDVYKFTVTVTQKSSLVTLKVFFDQTNFTKGQSSTVKVTFHNPTAQDIKGANFTFPLEGFNVFDVKGCSLDGDTVYSAQDINAGAIDSCSFSIYADEVGDYSQKATLTITDELGTQKVTNTTPVIVLPLGLEINRTFPDSATTGQTIDYYLTLHNTLGETLALNSMVLTIPTEWYVESAPSGFSQVGQQWAWTTTINGNDQKNLTFVLKAREGATTKIKEEYEFTMNGIVSSESATSTIEIVEEKPEITFRVSPEPLTFSKQGVIDVSVKNPTSSTFSKIDLTASVGDNSYTAEKETLSVNEDYTLLSQFFTVDQLEAITVDFTLSYTREDFSRRTVTDSITIEVVEEEVEELNESEAEDNSSAIAQDSPEQESNQTVDAELKEIIPDAELEALTEPLNLPWKWIIIGIIAFLVIGGVVTVIALKKDGSLTLFDKDRSYEPPTISTSEEAPVETEEKSNESDEASTSSETETSVAKETPVAAPAKKKPKKTRKKKKTKKKKKK